MSNLKISQLTSATTPLAGTEVLPIVQSGATVKVSVSNLTSGRDVSTGALTSTISTVSAIGLFTGPEYSFTKFSGTAQSCFIQNWSGTSLLTTNGTTNLSLGTNGAESWRLTSANNITQLTAATGINFTANSAAAGKTSQLLNWYEEGTWTPSFEANGQSGSYTYTTQTGWYTRVGNTVHGGFKIVWTALASVGAATRVIGLPFAWNASYDSSGAYATLANGVPHTNGLYMPVGTTGGGSKTAFTLYLDGNTPVTTTTNVLTNLSASGTLTATFTYVV